MYFTPSGIVALEQPLAASPRSFPHCHPSTAYLSLTHHSAPSSLAQWLPRSGASPAQVSDYTTPLGMQMLTGIQAKLKAVSTLLQKLNQDLESSNLSPQGWSSYSGSSGCVSKTSPIRTRFCAGRAQDLWTRSTEFRSYFHKRGTIMPYILHSPITQE